MTGAGAPTKADRLKAALRENLKRRKAQARGRQAADEPQRDGTVEPNASAARRGE
jgi:hypothetical protein